MSGDVDDYEEYFEQGHDGTVVNNEDVTVSIDQKNKEIIEFQTVKVIDGVYQDTVGDFKEKNIVDGQQVKKIVKKRPECPSCGYVLNQESDPIFLPGQCHECDQYVCPMCISQCEAGNRKMCPDHTGGHGVSGKTLCKSHVTDELQRIEFEREQVELDNELEREKQRENLRQQRRQNKHKRKMEKERLKKELIKMKLEARKQQLENQQQPALRDDYVF